MPRQIHIAKGEPSAAALAAVKKTPVKKASDALAEGLTIDPQNLVDSETRQQMLDLQKELGSGILQIGLDPTTYMGWGAMAPMFLEEFETPEEKPTQIEEKRFDKLRTGFDR